MIWVVCADISSADDRVYQGLYEKASAARKRRADRYLRQDDKIRCVTADALLQMVLGTESYEIEKNEFGKPYLKDSADFYFNLSHSGRYVVIAWGDTEMGVDVQQHEADTRTDILGARFFAPDEMDYAHRNPQRFYEIWTKKESYVKYIGKGLHRDLRSFSVLTPEPGIRYLYQTLEGGYSLSLCTVERTYAFEMLDVRQLLRRINLPEGNAR